MNGNQVGGQIGSTNTQMASRVAPMSSVEGAIGDLSSKLSAVEVEAERIGDKLRPILSSDVTKVGCDHPWPPINCELEERLQGLARRLEILAEQLSSLSGRICV